LRLKNQNIGELGLSSASYAAFKVHNGLKFNV